jgi:hypothetical protein
VKDVTAQIGSGHWLGGEVTRKMRALQLVLGLNVLSLRKMMQHFPPSVGREFFTSIFHFLLLKNRMKVSVIFYQQFFKKRKAVHVTEQHILG